MFEDNGNKCGKCQNHDYEVLKKGHARDCPFKKCDCRKCRLLDARSDILQVISGKETKLKGTKKDPNCGFCQNHGIKILRKGHVRSCGYGQERHFRLDNCFSCEVHYIRNEVNRLQIKMRRAMKEDRTLSEEQRKTAREAITRDEVEKVCEMARLARRKRGALGSAQQASCGGGGSGESSASLTLSPWVAHCSYSPTPSSAVAPQVAIKEEPRALLSEPATEPPVHPLGVGPLRVPKCRRSRQQAARQQQQQQQQQQQAQAQAQQAQAQQACVGQRLAAASVWRPWSQQQQQQIVAAIAAQQSQQQQQQHHHHHQRQHIQPAHFQQPQAVQHQLQLPLVLPPPPPTLPALQSPNHHPRHQSEHPHHDQQQQQQQKPSRYAPYQLQQPPPQPVQLATKVHGQLLAPSRRGSFELAGPSGPPDSRHVGGSPRTAGANQEEPNSSPANPRPAARLMLNNQNNLHHRHQHQHNHQNNHHHHPHHLQLSQRQLQSISSFGLPMAGQIPLGQVQQLSQYEQNKALLEAPGQLDMLASPAQTYLSVAGEFGGQHSRSPSVESMSPVLDSASMNINITCAPIAGISNHTHHHASPPDEQPLQLTQRSTQEQQVFSTLFRLLVEQFSQQPNRRPS